MEWEGVDDEGDERPYFLGVPCPVVAPGDVGPQGADDDTEGEEELGGVEENDAEAVEPFAEFGLMACGEARNAYHHDEEEECVAHHDDCDMEAEERRAEYGHEVGDRWVAAAHHGDEEAEAHSEHGCRQCHGVEETEEETEETYGDGHEVHAVEASRHGDVPTGDPSQDEDEKEEGGEQEEVDDKKEPHATWHGPTAADSPQGIGEEEEAECDVEHRQPTACGEGVVEAFGFEARRRR